MDSGSFISYVPQEFWGLKILLVDNDITSLSNIASTLQQHSYKVTISERATIALSILCIQTDEFNLVIADVNMPEMDYLEFMRSTQLIKDIPIVLMSSTLKRDMVEKARAHGAYFILMKPIPTNQLMNVWKYVYMHQIEAASQKSEHEANNSVEVIDSKSGADKKNERMKWTPFLDEKFKKVICELGEIARPKAILKLMKVPNLKKKQVENRLQRYRKQQVEHVQSIASSPIVNQFEIMSQMPSPQVPISHSQDRVNELRSLRETRTSPQECHEEIQPSYVERILGNYFSSGNDFNTFNHFQYNGNYSNVLNPNEFPMNFSSVSKHLPDNGNPSSIWNSNEFPMNFSSMSQHFPDNASHSNVLNPNDLLMNFSSVSQHFLDDGNHFNTLNHIPNKENDFNVQNSIEFPMNFNKSFQEAYLPPSDDFFEGLDRLNQPELDSINGEIMTENQTSSYYNSTQDNFSTRNWNP